MGRYRQLSNVNLSLSCFLFCLTDAVHQRNMSATKCVCESVACMCPTYLTRYFICRLGLGAAGAIRRVFRVLGVRASELWHGRTSVLGGGGYEKYSHHALGQSDSSYISLLGWHGKGPKT